MAKQVGPVHLRGQIGGIVFYVGPDGAGAKGESGLTKERVMTAPEFAGSRRAGSAFGLSAKGGSLVRKGIGQRVKMLAETRMTGRMNKRIYAIIKSDSSTDMLDEKQIHKGDLKLLKGFSWHKDKPLTTALLADYTVNIDRAAGLMEVRFASFVPKRGLKAPEGATHFELFTAGMSANFEKMAVISAAASGGVMAINGRGTGSLELSCAVATGGDLPLVLGLGILFYQEVGGKQRLLVEGSCFEIVGVA
jgi:hypothetical protein